MSDAGPTCCIHDCGRPAAVSIRWGGDAPPSDGDFCRSHANEISERLGPLLKANRAWVIYSAEEEGGNADH